MLCTGWVLPTVLVELAAMTHVSVLTAVLTVACGVQETALSRLLSEAEHTERDRSDLQGRLEEANRCRPKGFGQGCMQGPQEG